MSAKELRIGNRTAYFRKSITTPNFYSERVLARDSFQFVELWLKRNCTRALPYWDQAKTYYYASENLPPLSSPLTSYYCFLNAVKTLLIVKSQPFAERHGVGGKFEASKRALVNETVHLSNGGITGSLTGYLGESGEETLTLTEILSNLPFIHRAYRLTFTSHPEMFIPVSYVVYRKHPEDKYVWLSLNVEGRYSDRRRLRTLPEGFEVDEGYEDKCVVRAKNRIKWFEKAASKTDKERAGKRLMEYHRKMRRQLVYISASPDLWYLKRKMAGTKQINRYSLTLIFVAMHRLSELSRYDPKGLKAYLEGKENWLLTEFIESAPAQFVDEIACEITSLEFGLPKIRPRSP